MDQDNLNLSLSDAIFRFRYLIGIALTLTIVAGFGYSSYQPAVIPRIAEVSHSTGTVNLALSPATINIDPNTSQDIIVTINSDNNHTTAVAVELEYDPTTLTVNSITQGDFLSNSLSSAKIEGGKVKFTYAAPPDSGGTEGSGTLATISVTSKEVDSILSFNTQTIATTKESITYDADGKPISTNALHTALDSKVVINPADDPADDPAENYLTTSLRTTTNPTCTNISLSWDSVNNAPGYYVNISKNNSFTDHISSNKLSGSTNSYTFTSLDHNTTYYSRITLASIPDFPQYSPVFEVKTKDCSPATSPTPTPSNSPTPTPSITPSPSPTGNIITRIFKRSSPTPKPSASPRSRGSSLTSPPPATNRIDFTGSLNDIFGTQPEESTPSESSTPGFFQRIILGWQAIFSKLTSIL